jgi:choline dehydrogenase-like flavoprotein
MIERKILSFNPKVIVCGSGHSGSAMVKYLIDKKIRTLWITGALKQNARFGLDLVSESDFDPKTHEPLNFSELRSLGGLSNRWGGRLVPFDRVDFIPRDYLDLPGWPIDYSDLDPWFEAAYRFLGIKDIEPNGLNNGLETSQLIKIGHEGWTNHLYLHEVHDLKSRYLLRLDNYQLQSLGQDLSSGRIRNITIADPISHKKFSVPAKTVVLSAGITENNRIMLLHLQDNPRSFPITRHLVGAGYTTHINYQFEPWTDQSDLYRFRIYRGIRWRSRFSLAECLQRSLHLGNAAGVFSQRFQSKSYSVTSPKSKIPIFPEKQVKTKIIEFASRNRFFLNQIVNRADTSKFTIQSEHLPNSQSKITLGQKCDSFGRNLPNASITFMEQDFYTVAQTTVNLFNILNSHTKSQVNVDASQIALELANEYVMNTNAHRFGGTNMGRFKSGGLVNDKGEFFEFPGLFAAGTSVFPTSGQANPTLTNVALSLRIAHFISLDE